MVCPLPFPGSVYGVILNDHASLAKLGDAVDEAPYKQAPRAPILYIKPANTWLGNGAAVVLPQGADEVEIGATLGVVMGAPAARRSREHALEVVAGYVLVADLSLPHDSYYRPAIAEKCFDGACPLGDHIVPGDAVGDIAKVTLRTRVNDDCVSERKLNALVRDVPQLIADVSEFMTLRTGDVLLTGVEYLAPRAPVGARVRIEADGFASLEFRLTAGGARS